MTAAAHQVVVVLLAAEPVADLPRPMHQRVDRPMLAEQRQGAVDGRQPDRGAAVVEAGVDLLRGGVVGLGGEGVEHRAALAGGPHAVTGQELAAVRLRTASHAHRVASR
jgi:hypothetical protein